MKTALLQRTVSAYSLADSSIIESSDDVSKGEIAALSPTSDKSMANNSAMNFSFNGKIVTGWSDDEEMSFSPV